MLSSEGNLGANRSWFFSSVLFSGRTRQNTCKCARIRKQRFVQIATRMSILIQTSHEMMRIHNGIFPFNFVRYAICKN